MTQMRRPARRRIDVEEVLSPRLFKALADPRRITLFVELCRSRRPTTVTEISRCCPTDLSVVSRHLATLRDAGAVESTRRGREVHYAVRFRAVATTLRRIADAIEACCPEPERGETRR